MKDGLDKLDKICISILKGEIRTTQNIPCEEVIKQGCKACPFGCRQNKFNLPCGALVSEQLKETALEYLEDKFY